MARCVTARDLASGAGGYGAFSAAPRAKHLEDEFTNRDLFGIVRGHCTKCPCKQYVKETKEYTVQAGEVGRVHPHNDPGVMRCSRCGCSPEDHAVDGASNDKEIGNDYFAQGNYDQAVLAYSRAIQKRASDETLWSNRAAAFSAKGKHHEALSDATRAVEIRPEWAKARARKALSHFHLRQFVEAAREYGVCVRLEPGHEAYQQAQQSALAEVRRSKSKAAAASPHKLAKEAMRTKQYGKAVALYTNLIRASPRDPKLLANRSAAHAARGEHREALADAMAAAKLAPTWPRAWSRQGLALYYLGEYDRAAECYEEAARLDPLNAEVAQALLKARAAAKSEGRRELGSLVERGEAAQTSQQRDAPAETFGPSVEEGVLGMREELSLIKGRVASNTDTLDAITAQMCRLEAMLSLVMEKLAFTNGIERANGRAERGVDPQANEVEDQTHQEGLMESACDVRSRDSPDLATWDDGEGSEAGSEGSPADEPGATYGFGLSSEGSDASDFESSEVRAEGASVENAETFVKDIEVEMLSSMDEERDDASPESEEGSPEVEMESSPLQAAGSDEAKEEEICDKDSNVQEGPKSKSLPDSEHSESVEDAGEDPHWPRMADQSTAENGGNEHETVERGSLGEAKPAGKISTANLLAMFQRGPKDSARHGIEQAEPASREENQWSEWVEEGSVGVEGTSAIAAAATALTAQGLATTSVKEANQPNGILLPSEHGLNGEVQEAEGREELGDGGEGEEGERGEDAVPSPQEEATATEVGVNEEQREACSVFDSVCNEEGETPGGGEEDSESCPGDWDDGDERWLELEEEWAKVKAFCELNRDSIGPPRREKKRAFETIRPLKSTSTGASLNVLNIGQTMSSAGRREAECDWMGGARHRCKSCDCKAFKRAEPGSCTPPSLFQRAESSATGTQERHRLLEVALRWSDHLPGQFCSACGCAATCHESPHESAQREAAERRIRRAKDEIRSARAQAEQEEDIARRGRVAAAARRRTSAEEAGEYIRETCQDFITQVRRGPCSKCPDCPGFKVVFRESDALDPAVMLYCSLCGYPADEHPVDRAWARENERQQQRERARDRSRRERDNWQRQQQQRARGVQDEAKESAMRLLGVSHGASKKQVARAYKRMALKYHPDKNKSPKAADLFLRVTKAFQILNV